MLQQFSHVRRDASQAFSYRNKPPWMVGFSQVSTSYANNYDTGYHNGFVDGRDLDAAVNAEKALEFRLSTLDNSALASGYKDGFTEGRTNGKQTYTDYTLRHINTLELSLIECIKTTILEDSVSLASANAFRSVADIFGYDRVYVDPRHEIVQSMIDNEKEQEKEKIHREYIQWAQKIDDGDAELPYQSESVKDVLRRLQELASDHRSTKDVLSAIYSAKQAARDIIVYKPDDIEKNGTEAFKYVSRELNDYGTQQTQRAEPEPNRNGWMYMQKNDWDIICATEMQNVDYVRFLECAEKIKLAQFVPDHGATTLGTRLRVNWKKFDDWNDWTKYGMAYLFCWMKKEIQSRKPNKTKRAATFIPRPNKAIQQQQQQAQQQQQQQQQQQAQQQQQQAQQQQQQAQQQQQQAQQQQQQTSTLKRIENYGEDIETLWDTLLKPNKTKLKIQPRHGTTAQEFYNKLNTNENGEDMNQVWYTLEKNNKTVALAVVTDYERDAALKEIHYLVRDKANSAKGIGKELVKKILAENPTQKFAIEPSNWIVGSVYLNWRYPRNHEVAMTQIEYIDCPADLINSVNKVPETYYVNKVLKTNDVFDGFKDWLKEEKQKKQIFDGVKNPEIINKIIKGRNVLKNVWEGLAKKYNLTIVPTGRTGPILDDYANAVLWKLVTDFVKNNRGYNKDTDPVDPAVTPAPVDPAVTPAPVDPAVTPDPLDPPAPAVTPDPPAPAVTPDPPAPAVTPVPAARPDPPAPVAELPQEAQDFLNLVKNKPEYKSYVADVFERVKAASGEKPPAFEKFIQELTPVVSKSSNTEPSKTEPEPEPNNIDALLQDYNPKAFVNLSAEEAWREEPPAAGSAIDFAETGWQDHHFESLTKLLQGALAEHAQCLYQYTPLQTTEPWRSENSEGLQVGILA